MSDVVTFETLTDVITYVFRHEQTSLLSLDRICEVINSPNLFISTKLNGVVQCSTITRRRISSTLSSSELFVRAGPPRTCLWAIRPNNPLFISDGAISASIEQMLTTNGPMTLEQFVNTTELAGADEALFDRFLRDHASDFACAEDGTWWFTDQVRPSRNDFESFSHALVFAFSNFTHGASVEQLHWFLCLSTVGGKKQISRRNISRELSRRTDLFMHISRARYTLISQIPNETSRPHSLPQFATTTSVFDNLQFSYPHPQMQLPDFPPQETINFDEQTLEIPEAPIPPRQNNDEDEFDPDFFFGSDFHLAFD